MNINPWQPTECVPHGITWQQHALIAGLIQFALPRMQIPDFSIGKSLSLHHNWATSMLYRRYDTGSCGSFTKFFTAHRPYYLTERFRTLFRQSKGLYSTGLLSSLCAPWPTGAFCHYFASSKMVSCQQFCYKGPLHRVLVSQWMLRHLFHDIGSDVQWYLEQSAFCHANWRLWWNCLLLLLLLVYQSKFWSSFVPFPDVF